jgi:hypothetical protein
MKIRQPHFLLCISSLSGNCITTSFRVFLCISITLHDILLVHISVYTSIHRHSSLSCLSLCLTSCPYPIARKIFTCFGTELITSSISHTFDCRMSHSCLSWMLAQEQRECESKRYTSLLRFSDPPWTYKPTQGGLRTREHIINIIFVHSVNNVILTRLIESCTLSHSYNWPIIGKRRNCNPLWLIARM